MFDFLKPNDFDPTVLYELRDGERICGACIRACFGTFTDMTLRESVPTLSPVTDCAKHDMGCAAQE